MLFTHRRLLLAIRPGVDPVGPVEAGPVDHRGVIGEMSTVPPPAEEAHTAVAEAIVHPTVKADVGTPVSGVPRVKPAAKTPVTRSPKKSRPGCKHPGSRNPVVARIAISPVSRSPEVSIPGANRLRVHRKDGRSDRNGNK